MFAEIFISFLLQHGDEKHWNASIHAYMMHVQYPYLWS